jgi:hypothetical protein
MLIFDDEKLDRSLLTMSDTLLERPVKMSKILLVEHNNEEAADDAPAG